MPDIITSVNVSVKNTPIDIGVTNIPVEISVSQNGLQGPQGPSGSNGAGSSNINFSGYGTTGSYDLRYLQTGVSGFWYPYSNPLGFTSSSSTSGLIKTGDADLRYLLSGSSGYFYPWNNPNFFISSGDVNLISGALSLRLGLTGQTLINLINTISSNTGIFLKSGDNQTVYTTGYQNIAGIKTFSSFVGIGTNNPQEQLHVSGKAIIDLNPNMQINIFDNPNYNLAGIEIDDLTSGSFIDLIIKNNTAYFQSHGNNSTETFLVAGIDESYLTLNSQNDTSIFKISENDSGAYLKLTRGSFYGDGYAQLNFPNITGLNSAKYIYILPYKSGTIGLQEEIVGLSGQLDISGSKLSSVRVTGSSNLQIADFIGVGNVTLSFSGTKIFVSGNTGDYSSYYSNQNTAQFIKSGDVSSTYATIANLNTDITNLVLTGQALNNRINGLSGELQNSGSNLRNLINGLSGELQNSGTNLNNLIGTEKNKPTITGFSVSGGSSLTGLISIIPGANITFNQLGTTGFSIASAAGGGAIPKNLVTGSGTLGYLARFTSTFSGVENSALIDSGTSVTSQYQFLSEIIKANANSLNIHPSARMFSYQNYR